MTERHPERGGAPESNLIEIAAVLSRTEKTYK
jgi:hypothetical protein